MTRPHTSIQETAMTDDTNTTQQLHEFAASARQTYCEKENQNEPEK